MLRLRMEILTLQPGLLVLGLSLLALTACSGRNAPNLGYQSSHVLVLNLSYSAKIEQNKIGAFYTEATSRISNLPGVAAVGAGDGLPMDPRKKAMVINPDRSPQEAGSVNWCKIMPGYLKALSIPLLKGRDFADKESADPVNVIVSQSFVDKYFPGQQPIGKSFVIRDKKYGMSPPLIIIGEAGDVRPNGSAEPTCYVPFAENPPDETVVVVRVTSSQPKEFASAVRDTILELDPDAGVTAEAPLDQRPVSGLR